MLRAPIRRAAFTASFPKARPRPSFRFYSTNPGPPLPRRPTFLTGLGIAIGVVGSVILYSYNTEKAAGAVTSKVKANYKPTPEDYQKVRVVDAIQPNVSLPRGTPGIQQGFRASGWRI
jgi:hypothetical protein